MDDYQLRLKVQQIIERSRHHEEAFLIDSKKAAEDIDALYKSQKKPEKVELLRVA